MTPKQLGELIRLAVRAELKIMKKEIIQELRSTSNSGGKLNEIHKGFRQNYQVQQTRRNNFSNNPTLNQLLNDTQPLNESQGQMMDYEYDINLPVDNHGRPIQNVPETVLNAMNRDYSHLVQAQTKQSSNMRHKYQQMMEEVDPTFSDSMSDQQFEQNLDAEMSQWS